MSELFAILQILGGLGLFLYGIQLMSDRIYKRADRRLESFLQTLTSNRFTGVLTGTVVTGIIQSSSATTVILVSLVHAGMINLEQSIAVVMGANIGTTLTAWIVSIVGFKFKITTLALPALAVSIPMFFNKRDSVREWGEILIGFGILFLGLDIMKSGVPDPRDHLGMFEFIKQLSEMGFFSVLLFVVFGTLLTIITQSSSAAMSITLVFAHEGWVDYRLAAAIVLGENIGTTITAYLATLGMNVTAKRTARAHMMFNIIGVCWMLVSFVPFLHMVDKFVPGDVTDPEKIPIHLSAFHTAFNITNTCALIWFVPMIARLVTHMVKPKPVAEGTGEDYALPFLTGNIPESVESNLINVRAEIARMSDIVYDMVLSLMNIIPDDAEAVDETYTKISDQEELTDNMQAAISEFLRECMVESLNERQAGQIQSIQLITNELESIADSCQNMANLMRRRGRRQLKFHATGVDELLDYTSMVLDFLQFNRDYLKQRVLKLDVDRAYKLESAINKKRKQLRKISRNQMSEGADVRAELVYIDMVRHLEHIGDYSLNISQAIRDIR